LKNIDPEGCVFLDEMGSCLDANPSHGRSPLGERVYDGNPSKPGERLSAVAILTGDGIEAEYLYNGTMTAKRFLAYLDIYLLGILTNGKTLVMDNLPAHHAKKVKAFLVGHNILYLFIPPYSPEFNPIEEAFSKAKQSIRRQKARTPEMLDQAIRNAIKTVTADDAVNYINHSYEFVYVTN
jgi:transposase